MIYGHQYSEIIAHSVLHIIDYKLKILHDGIGTVMKGRSSVQQEVTGRRCQPSLSKDITLHLNQGLLYTFEDASYHVDIC